MVKQLQLLFKLSYTIQNSINVRRAFIKQSTYQQIKQIRIMYQYVNIDNFNESFVMTPIQLNPINFNHNLKARQINAINKGNNLGFYQQYKLTEYLANGFIGVDNNANINLETRNKQFLKNGAVIDVVTIDQDSNVGQIGSKFVQLMNKYATYDVSFITVTGQQNAGKSFFLDKILNLSQIKGNNFSLKNWPGIYLYSTPFMKDGLCIFLMQLSGCKLSSDAFKLLNVVCLGLSSSIVYLEKDDTTNSNQDSIVFYQNLSTCIPAFQFQKSFSQQENLQNIKVRNFYHISRSPTKNVDHLYVDNRLKIFENNKKLYLPNAAASTFKEDSQELSKYSFLSKQFINSEYIIALSHIFKQIYQQTTQKRFQQLTISGNIVNKLVRQFLSSLNSHKNILINSVYDNIIKQLYISAYNFCVIGYHDELQLFFEDEQPKNSNTMYQAFLNASNNTINKFNQFNLNKALHQQYLQKLYYHIEIKQKLLSSINKQKTYDFLIQRFNKLSQNNDKNAVLALIKKQRIDLDDGRTQALQKFLVSMLGNTSSDHSSIQKLQKLTQEKIRLNEQYNILIIAHKQQEQTKRRKYLELEKTEQQLQKQLKKIHNQISIGQSKIDPATIEKLKLQRQKLGQKKVQVADKLKNYKSQNNQVALNQVCLGYQQRIEEKTRRQVQLNRQVQQILQKTNQNPETKSTVKPKQITNVNSKLKQSETKKQIKK